MRRSWTVGVEGNVIYRDTDEHVALVLHTLRIEEVNWKQIIDAYVNRWTPCCRDLDAKIAALAQCYQAHSPHRAVPPVRPDPIQCPACKKGQVVATIARRNCADSDDYQGLLVYGRCWFCGHGLLLSGTAPPSVYASPDYFIEQSTAGAGYDDYESERAYREAKGERLFNWIALQTGHVPRRVLEVGSSFGFTRKAAENLGSRTFGVDLSRYAADRAKRLYGMDTFVGTLEQLLDARRAERNSFDLVLYQFVMEHLPDPAAELRLIAQSLTPDGHLALLVPSMDALEVDIFGASYRSFRSDHIHIFSWLSIGFFLADAGLIPVSGKTECNAHLLRGFLTEEELETVYQSGRGPDMLILAKRRFT